MTKLTTLWAKLPARPACRKATELSIPCITALDTARILVNALRSDHDISGMELVDIATLHRDAANGK